MCGANPHVDKISGVFSHHSHLIDDLQGLRLSCVSVEVCVPVAFPVGWLACTECGFSVSIGGFFHRKAPFFHFALTSPEVY